MSLTIAAPAFATGTPDQDTVAANTDVTVTVAASVDELNADNEKVTVDVPDGFRVLACLRVDGFTCTTSTADAPRRRATDRRRCCA